jgi:prepilin-type N-terminal cleavage/methylation domain-containing protein
MKRNKKNGFSLLEVIAAVVILAVVAAATVATVAPMKKKSEDKLDVQQVATLNAMAQTYFLELGRYPNDVTQLARADYLPYTTREERTRVNAMRTKYNYVPTTGIFSVKP